MLFMFEHFLIGIHMECTFINPANALLKGLYAEIFPQPAQTHDIQGECKLGVCGQKTILESDLTFVRPFRFTHPSGEYRSNAQIAPTSAYVMPALLR
jgi:hypothetical protein